MTQTFVLVMMMWWNSGVAISTVPGYTSLADCREAAVAADQDAARTPGWAKATPLKAYCIPGPKKNER